MKQRPWLTLFATGCLALLCFAEGAQVLAQKGGQSGGGRSGGGGGGGGGARASAPSGGGARSSGSSGGGARASAPSGGSRSSAAPTRSSSPAPRSAPTSSGASRGSSAPRYESAPRSQPEAPRSQPRYEQPRSDQPRYEQPRESPRYVPADNSGRVYDGGRRSSDGPSYGPGSGRSGATNDSPRYEPRVTDADSGARDGGNYAPRSEDNGWNGLGFDRVPQRTPVPRLSSSTPGRGPGAGRYARASSDRATAEGEGMVRMPQSSVTRESILQRYPSASAPTADARPRGENAGIDLSRARGSNRLESVSNGSGRASSKATAPERGSLEATRRERESIDGFQRMRSSDPGKARQIEAAGAKVAEVGDITAGLAISAGVSFGTGSCGDWFCDPTCDGNDGSWFWFGTYGWPVWCSSSCGAGWPWGWGFSYWGSGWGFGWNSCGYWPYWYGYYSPYYSDSYYTPAPAYYSTVIYQGYEEDYQGGGEPAPNAKREYAGEGAVAVDHEAGAKVRIQRSVIQYLDLGDEAFAQGRYSDAVHYYARAVEAQPDNGRLYLILSDALFATGDYHYAAFALRRALELDSTLLAPAVDKHGFYSDANEFERQLAVAESYLDEHFLDDDARLVLAANYLFGNRPAQAADLLLSAFSKGVRESNAGILLLRRAEELRGKSALPK